MKPAEAKKLIEDMHQKGQVKFDPKKGLLLTAKAEGLSLLELAELSVDQVSRIGETLHPLHETRKRVKALLGANVSPEVLRGLIAELTGETVEDCPEKEGAENAEGNNLQTVLPGFTEEGRANGGNPDVSSAEVERPSAPDTGEESGAGGTVDNLREENRSDGQRRLSRSSRGNQGG